ncbi:MAG: hypothetical protein ACNFW9_03825 [Candidatus Kerfeldbacteria bacterium]
MRKLLYTFFSLVLFLGAFFVGVSDVEAAYGDVSNYTGLIIGGDGGDKLNAYFDFAEDIIRDSSGNWYVADTYNNVIRKITSAGIVSTYAGSGSYGYVDAASITAEFALPRGLAIGPDGSIYVADTANSKVRRISASGTVSTVVSSGLSSPYGVKVYGTSLYIADSGNNSIKKVSTAGGTVTTLTSSLSDPRRMDISTDGGTLYVADNGNHRVVSVNTSSGAITVIAGSGTSGYTEGVGAAAQFENVWGVALNGNELYVSDHDNWTIDRIRKINLSTKQTSLIYQDTAQEEMIYPAGLVYYSGYVYTANAGLGTIHRFNVSNGADNSLFAGSDRWGNKNGATSSALFGRPYDLAMSSDGKYIYVAENNKVRKIDVATGVVSHVIGSSVDNYRGEGTDYDVLPIRFSTVQGITINSSGTRLYVVDRWNNRIRGVNLTADPISTFLVTGSGLINSTGSDDNGYQEGTRCSSDIRTTGVSGCSYFKSPTGIVISPDNQYLYVSDTGNNRIRKVRISDGQTWLIAGSGTAGYSNAVGSAAMFNRPFGLTIDASGSNIYVADSNNHVIRKISLATSAVTTVVGSGSAGYREAIGSDAALSYPEYIKFGADGYLYFTESGSMRVRQINVSSGLTKLVAGSGERGYKMGTQSEAKFNNLKGLAPDTANNSIYVADSWNDLIFKIDTTGDAPYTNPAPGLSSVTPGVVNPDWDSGSGLLVKVEGANFMHGLVTYLGDIPANKTYVQNSSSIAVDLPLSLLQPGWYDITVINLDGQVITLERALGITDSSGNVPNVYYEYSGKTSDTTAGSELPPVAAGSSFFTHAQNLRGSFHVTSGNIMGSDEAEIIVGTGEGMGPHVRVFDSNGVVKAQFFAYDSALRNGVTVTACDVNGDGYKEIVTAQGRGGWPLVRIFDGYGNVINDGFYVLDGKFTGGVNVACGDIHGDGISEIVVSAMHGGGPHVLVYTIDGTVLANFMAYDVNFRGGINVTTADADGDGADEIITGPQWGSPHVQIFQIRSNLIHRLSPGFYAFHRDYKGGVSVAGVDTDGDGTKELVIGVGDNATPLVKVYNIQEELLKNFYVFDHSFLGGVHLTGGDVDGDGADELMVIPRGNGGPQVRIINVDEV